jgi:hypothetical protein
MPERNLNRGMPKHRFDLMLMGNDGLPVVAAELGPPGDAIPKDRGPNPVVRARQGLAGPEHPLPARTSRPSNHGYEVPAGLEVVGSHEHRNRLLRATARAQPEDNLVRATLPPILALTARHMHDGVTTERR